MHTGRMDSLGLSVKTRVSALCATLSVCVPRVELACVRRFCVGIPRTLHVCKIKTLWSRCMPFSLALIDVIVCVFCQNLLAGFLSWELGGGLLAGALGLRALCARARRRSAMRSSSITLDGDVYDEVAIDRQLEHAEAQLLQLRVAKAELINRRRRRSELTEGTERSFVQLSSVETSEAQGAQVPAGLSGATRGGLLTRHFRHACATAWTHCATSAASSFLGGVLDGVPYPCSPGARSYCDGEVELEHEVEAEAEVRLPRRFVAHGDSLGAVLAACRSVVSDLWRRPHAAVDSPTDSKRDRLAKEAAPEAVDPTGITHWARRIGEGETVEGESEGKVEGKVQVEVEGKGEGEPMGAAGAARTAVDAAELEPGAVAGSSGPEAEAEAPAEGGASASSTAGPAAAPSAMAVGLASHGHVHGHVGM